MHRAMNTHGRVEVQFHVLHVGEWSDSRFDWSNSPLSRYSLQWTEARVGPGTGLEGGGGWTEKCVTLPGIKLQHVNRHYTSWAILRTKFKFSRQVLVYTDSAQCHRNPMKNFGDETSRYRRVNREALYLAFILWASVGKQVTDLNERGFDFRKEKLFFFFATFARPVLLSTQAPVSWISGSASPGVKCVELTHTPPYTLNA
jgi:hypothetical protein